VEARQDGRASIIPMAGDRAWSVFWRLDARRTGNGYGANAISPSEIDAYARMYGMRLRRWELDALDVMEASRLRWLDRMARRDEDGEPDVVEGQPVTPALVKALFG